MTEPLLNSAAQASHVQGAERDGASPAITAPASADLVARLREADIIVEYDDSGLKDEFRGKGHRVWSSVAQSWIYPGDKIIGGKFDPKQVADLIERQQARIAELEKDAARYRWLRDNARTVEWIHELGRTEIHLTVRQHLDAAIDSSMEGVG